VDDRALVQGLLDKDGAAESYFHKTFRPLLYRSSSFILGPGDPEVEDVIQETFLAALRDLPKFRFHCEFVRWVRRICVYRCYERLRARKRQVANMHEDMEVLMHRSAMRKTEETEREGEEQALLTVLKVELELMGGRCRELLELRDREDKTYGELSQTLKIPIGTVMSRLARCREKLKERVLRAAKRRGNFP
jgi:RNA polymerase sigma factor (sigma-70 family)